MTNDEYDVRPVPRGGLAQVAVALPGPEVLLPVCEYNTHHI